MNKIYRLGSSRSLGSLVVASELAIHGVASSVMTPRHRHATSVLAAAIACACSPAVAGSLDGGRVNGTAQIAYGPSASIGLVPSESNAIAIGNDLDNTNASATDLIMLGTQLRNNAANSILIGNNGVELDKDSPNSVVLSPEATGGVRGGRWGQPVTRSAANFSFISSRANNRVTSSAGAIALAGTAINAADAVSIGTNAVVSATEGVAVGRGARANGESAVALGAGGVAAGARAVAVGKGARATQSGDVALGDSATTAVAVATENATIARTSYAFAGTTPANTVSIGDVGAERTLTNLAAGRLSPPAPTQ